MPLFYFVTTTKLIPRFRHQFIVRLVVEDCDLLVGVHQHGQVALAADVTLVELLDVAQHDAAVADALRPFAGLHDVQGKLVGVVLRAGRQETEVTEDFGVAKIVFQPVAHDGVGTEQEELVQVVAHLEPGDDRAYGRSLAAAGDDVEQQLAPLEQLVGIDRPHHGFFLVPPQPPRRVGPGQVKQKITRQRADVGVGARLPPVAEVLFVGSERIVHVSDAPVGRSCFRLYLVAGSPCRDNSLSTPSDSRILIKD